MVGYRKCKYEEKKQLLDFMSRADRLFPVPLSQKQNLDQLCEKLLSYGVVIGGYEGNDIVGIICGYMNDTKERKAYISVLCVLTEYQGNSIARKLIELFINDCVVANMKSIFLYTHKTNIPAQKLYEKMGFRKSEDKNRQDDFVYTLVL